MTVCLPSRKKNALILNMDITRKKQTRDTARGTSGAAGRIICAGRRTVSSLQRVLFTLWVLVVLAALFAISPARTSSEEYVALNSSTGTRYTDLHTAVSEASDGDEILLTADVHLTDGQLRVDRSVTIRPDGRDRTIYVDFDAASASDNSAKWGIYLSSGHPRLIGSPDARLIIDGGNKSRARGLVYVSTGEGAELCCVTVTGGRSSASGDNGAGGVYVSKGTDTPGETLLARCIIENCTSEKGNGGGITLNSKNITVRDCVIRNNTASGKGGGLYQPAKTSEASFTGCTVSNCVFSGNTASSGSQVFSGISLTYFDRCHFDGAEDQMYIAGGSSSLFFGEDFMQTGRTSLLSLLPAYDGGILIGYADGDDETEEALYTATAESFDAYVSLTESRLGIDLDRTRIDGLSRACAVYGSTRFLIYYSEYDAVMRVIAEPAACSDTGLYVHPEGAVMPKVVLINLADETNEETTSNTRYGLSLLIRLSDGSFVVVDGGYRDGLYASASDTSSTRLYNKMVELSGGRTSGLVISAWLITHSHNDHAAAVCSFASRYASKVTLERLIYNFPPDYEYEPPHGGDDVNKSANTAWRDNVKDLVYAKKVVKPHPLDHLEIAGAAIDVLYTTELVKPKLITNINETSVIYMISAGSKKILVTGDASQYTEEVLLGTFDTALHADMITVCHHGFYYRSVSSALYEAVAPTIALWPASSTVYNAKSNINNASNKWLTANLTSDNIIVAKDYTGDDGWGWSADLDEAEPELSMSLRVDDMLSADFTADVRYLGEAFTGFALRMRFESDSASRLISGVKERDGIYSFTCDGITSQRMSEVFSAQLVGFDADGVGSVLADIPVSEGWSIERYCSELHASHPDDGQLTAFMATLLKLGQAAQRFTGHMTGRLAGSSMPWVDVNAVSTIPDPASDDVRSFASEGWERIVSAGLSIENRVGLFFRIRSNDYEGLALEIRKSSSGTTSTLDLTQVPDGQTGQIRRRLDGTLAVTLDKLLPWEYDTVYTLRLMRDGNTLSTVTYSVNSYCCAKASDPDAGYLARAVYSLGVAAKAYRGQ